MHILVNSLSSAVYMIQTFINRFLFNIHKYQLYQVGYSIISFKEI